MLSQGSPVGVMAVPQQQSPQPLPLSPPPLSPPPSHPLLDSSEDEQDYSPAKSNSLYMHSLIHVHCNLNLNISITLNIPSCICMHH